MKEHPELTSNAYTQPKGKGELRQKTKERCVVKLHEEINVKLSKPDKLWVASAQNCMAPGT